MFCEQDLVFAGRTIGRAACRCLSDCCDHFRVGVAQDKWAPGADKVEIASPIYITDSGSLGFLENKWCAADSAEGTYW